jgi:hypothetical protein
MADLKIQSVFELPPDVAAALHDRCCETGESAAAVVADAVAIFLDESAGDFEADQDAAERAITPALVEGVLRLVTP